MAVVFTSGPFFAGVTPPVGDVGGAGTGVNLAYSVATGIAAAGVSSQANATLLTAEYNEVTSVAPSAGVRVRSMGAGGVCIICNYGANLLTVWPTSGVAIKPNAVNISISLGVNSSITLVAKSATEVSTVGVG